jgi:hypothetical protein
MILHLHPMYPAIGPIKYSGRMQNAQHKDSTVGLRITLSAGRKECKIRQSGCARYVKNEIIHREMLETYRDNLYGYSYRGYLNHCHVRHAKEVWFYRIRRRKGQ